MAKLKPSEFRLLLAFSTIVFVLANVFGYQMLQKRHNDVKDQRVALESSLDQAEGLALQEGDSIRKEAWLATRVPVYPNDDYMKTFLIKFVRQKAAAFGIEAELHSQEPKMEGGFMRSKLEVKEVSGTIDTLVKWVYSLQDPEQFRAITSLEFKAKPKEPKTVYCELVIEQWWNPESPEIAANSGLVPPDPGLGEGGEGVQPPLNPAPDATPNAPAPPSPPTDLPSGGTPAPPDAGQPVVTPPPAAEPEQTAEPAEPAEPAAAETGTGAEEPAPAATPPARVPASASAQPEEPSRRVILPGATTPPPVPGESN